MTVTFTVINDWTATIVVFSKNCMLELMMHIPGVKNDKTFTHHIKISHNLSLIFDRSSPPRGEKDLYSNINRTFEIHNLFIIMVGLRVF